MSGKYYLTTPLYYVNSKPHIGHSYTNIASDTLARFQRLSGKDVLFLTGTDEHGQKIARAAQEAGMEPKPFTDKMSRTFRDLWETLHVSYDDFIRTTEPRHVETVQHVWKKLQEKKELYTGKYSGWYCTPCETFWTEGQVLRPPEDTARTCPECKRPVDMLEEENYFFRISKYQKWLEDEIRSDRLSILPDIRKNEVLGFLSNNVLQDLCISRPKSRLSWGIPSPLSESHVTYVWFDALINYISACGYPQDTKKFAQWWPADVHIIGKDILRHHAIYWPILLHVLGLELPRKIFAHGWWVQGGQKMSKSFGNVIDPIEIVNRYGVDPYRYFLLAETPFGSDGTFTEEALVDRFNHDLANDLGNLLHRTLTMCEKYFGGKIPAGVSSRCQGELRRDVDELVSQLTPLMERLGFSEALFRIWTLINHANRTIEEKAPWKLFKEGKRAELEVLIVELLEVLKATAQAVWPFIPNTGEAIWAQLGIREPLAKVALKEKMWGYFEKGGTVKKGQPLFPRIEVG